MQKKLAQPSKSTQSSGNGFCGIVLEFALLNFFKEHPLKNTSRRVFMMQVAVASTAVISSQAMAQAMVDAKDPQAVALAYVADTTKVDAKKFPKHAAAQKCLNCQLYTGKPADASGGCALFAGKLVAGNGWCSAYVKKA
jgi:exopolysaccharide biosynthesis protein